MAAHLKAIARVDIPAIFVPGGSMRPGPNQTTSLVAGAISLRQKQHDGIDGEEAGAEEASAVISQRMKEWKLKEPPVRKGVLKRYTEHALSSMQGAGY